jgi:lysophospholipase L1-like esterase
MKNVSSLRRSLLVAAVGVSSLGAFAASASGSVAHTKPAPKTMYYVNIGDSYAEGYQPGFTDNSETLNGYANKLTTLLAEAHHPMTLENFGCGGASTNSLLNTVGCSYLATNGVAYPTTSQAAAALSFIAAHPGQIGLIVISIGGNDFESCPGAPVPDTCIAQAMPTMQSNLENLLAQLRSAAGASTPILGLTYPDVELALWRLGANGKALAADSVTQFKTVINPTLKAAYDTVKASFVDITTAAGSYIPWNKAKKFPVSGTLPIAVGNICTLAWTCQNYDIHPRDAGYTLIANTAEKAYLAALKKK